MGRGIADGEWKVSRKLEVRKKDDKLGPLGRSLWLGWGPLLIQQGFKARPYRLGPSCFLLEWGLCLCMRERNRWSSQCLCALEGGRLEGGFSSLQSPSPSQLSQRMHSPSGVSHFPRLITCLFKKGNSFSAELGNPTPWCPAVAVVGIMGRTRKEAATQAPLFSALPSSAQPAPERGSVPPSSRSLQTRT